MYIGRILNSEKSKTKSESPCGTHAHPDINGYYFWVY